MQIDVRVISGKEEARLIYLGVASGLNLGEKRAVFIDIGGGSTEVIVGNQQQYEFLDSLKLGAIRLSNMFFPPGDLGPVNPRDDANPAACSHDRRPDFATGPQLPTGPRSR